MNPLCTRTALPTAALLPLLMAWLAPACAGTETDNPVVQTPDYRSPSRFEPQQMPPPGCAPPSDDAPPRLPLWGRSGNYLVGVDVVGAVPRRGLVVLDLSEPAAPRVVAELPLSGYPRQLLVEGSSATLVIDELASFSAPPLPPPAALETQTRLVRFDLSTPSAPQRIGEAALEDEFWQLQARGDGYWVTSGRIDPATQRCDAAPNLCGSVTRAAMLFTRYSWSDTGGWAAGERLELPPGPRVWMTEAGFATSTGHDSAGAVLSFAAFAADGSLGPVQTLQLSAPIVSGSPLYLDSQRVGVFSYELSDGSAAFSLYALDGTELGRIARLSQNLAAGTHFVPGGVLVASGSPSEAGAYIGLGQPGAPSQVAMPQASAFLPLAEPGAEPSRALGWRSDPATGGTTFSLWELTAAPPTLLDTLPTTLAAPQSASELQLSDGRVVFSLRGSDGAPLTGSLSWEGDALALAGPIAGGYGEQVLAAGDWLYEPDALGLAFGNASQGSSQRQTWDEGSLLDVTAVPGGEARLALDYARGVLQLFVTRGTSTEAIAVAPGARRLLPAGERLIVLSTEPRSQCQQTGLDCSDYAPNVAIVELSPLRSVTELPLPELPVPELGAQSRVEQSWSYSADDVQSPVRLGEQTWLLESEYSATCLSEADCAALGIRPVPFEQAGVSTGQQGCEPQAPSCPQPPQPTVYGAARRRVYHLLDAAAATLSEPLIVDGERGTPFELWPRPVFSRDTLLDLQLEPSAFPQPGSAPPAASAFLLERYVLNADRGLDALPVINIPGYPVALLDDAELLTLEPRPALDGTAQLHRVRLGRSGASVRASRALQARAGTVKIVGDSAVYLRGPADGCEPVSHVETFALDASLTPRAALELPGGDWTVLDADHANLVLQRGHAFVRIAVDPGGNPAIAGFATAPSAVGGARWQDGVVRAIGANRVIRLEP